MAETTQANEAKPGPWEVSSINVHRNSFQCVVRVRGGVDVHPDTAERLARAVEEAPAMAAKLTRAAGDLAEIAACIDVVRERVCAMADADAEVEALNGIHRAVSAMAANIEER